MPPTRVSLRMASAACALLLPAVLFAQSESSQSSSSSERSSAASSEASSVVSGYARMVVEQVGPEEGVTGVWSLLKPDYKRVDMGETTGYTFEKTPAGNYTIVATPPSGATTSIELWRGSSQERRVDLPQISFFAGDGDSLRIVITYVYTRVGKISVTSEPQGLSYTMKGPNNLTYTGTTPMEYTDAPIGQYTITYDKIEGCIAPKPKSDKLLHGSRIQFSIKVVCDRLDQLPQTRMEENALEFVTVSIGDERVTFDDVRTKEWFAASVHAAIRTGIMSGYKGPDGKLTGKFGPGDRVTLAQLAKVAHGLAGIDESKDRSTPQNERARDTWFSDVYASAERRGWLAFRAIREDPSRPATRAEVVCTLLQALDVPRLWPKGTKFTDVTSLTTYADCIETVAVDGLVSGDDDGTFGPERPINRAELSKILVTAMDIYGEKTAEIRGNYDGVK